MYVRRVCVELLRLGGVDTFRNIVCSVSVYRIGVWFDFVRSALLLAVVACILLSFEVMPCLCCFLRVTQAGENCRTMNYIAVLEQWQYTGGLGHDEPG